MKKNRIIGMLACVGLAWAAVSPVAGQNSQNTILLLVRHGEAYSNLSNPPDMPREKLDSLSPKGIAEVIAAGGVSKRYPVAAVVASPTGRTRETAVILAKAAGLTGITAEDTAFASVKMGTMSDGSSSTWEWRFAEWKAGRDPRPAGGESFEDAAQRAVRAVQSLAARHPGKAIVVVTHSDIVAALIGHAAGTPIGQRYEKHKVPTGSLSEISISGDGVLTLVRQGDRPRKRGLTQSSERGWVYAGRSKPASQFRGSAQQETHFMAQIALDSRSHQAIREQGTENEHYGDTHRAGHWCGNRLAGLRRDLFAQNDSLDIVDLGTANWAEASVLTIAGRHDTVAFTRTELDGIATFSEQGGGILLMANHPTGFVRPQNQVAEALHLPVKFEMVQGGSAICQLLPHEISADCDGIAIRTCCTMTIAPNALVVPLATHADRAIGPMAAAIEAGEGHGRVVAVTSAGHIASLDDSQTDLYSSASNARWTLNSLSWLQ